MTHPATQVTWDAIVIGTGIGGGTLGRALAEAGWRVLFLERGHADSRQAQNGLSEIFVPEARAARGLWPTPIRATVDGITQDFYAPLGAGPGGSSVFYAATLERPERHDLDPTPGKPHPTGGWPVSFDAFAPYYAHAAALYRVYGSPDPLSPETALPLRPPPPLNAVEDNLMRSLKAAGMSPYHAHTALEGGPDCAKCLGHKCPRVCKMDGRSAGLEPALATGRATLVTGAQVTRLITRDGVVRFVEARLGQETLTFEARQVVLAAGALNTPRLLLASATETTPNGVANSSGMVGRNLMFHLNEMVALWPKGRHRQTTATKAISFRDLYHRDGDRFGTVQAMGIRASYGEIVHYLNRMLAQKGLSRLAPLSRVPAALAYRLFGSAQIFVGLMEDLPYPENRVTHDASCPDQITLTYTLHPELKARRAAFRKAMRRALRGHRHVFLGLQPELNWGHPCGTLRFGHDPATSVLRPDGRTHDVVNLWVSDASFMPTSMGVNPSLTIAAYALHVADQIQKAPS